MLELIEEHLLQKHVPQLVHGTHWRGGVLHMSRVRTDEGVSLRKFAVWRCGGGRGVGGLSGFHLEGSCF